MKCFKRHGETAAFTRVEMAVICSWSQTNSGEMAAACGGHHNRIDHIRPLGTCMLHHPFVELCSCIVALFHCWNVFIVDTSLPFICRTTHEQVAFVWLQNLFVVNIVLLLSTVKRNASLISRVNKECSSKFF